jgi:DNA uptake protein ComE-like DNA-binding protein
MKSHFNFNKQERNGIFFLLLLITVLLLTYFMLSNHPLNDSTSNFQVDEVNQSKYDSLVALSNIRANPNKSKFNPNYISDFKGYTLGISALEMDKLKEHRRQNKFVNSAREFQVVTGVSDSLLNEISPLFKFPEWLTNTKIVTKREATEQLTLLKTVDINQASANDLRQVNGIGEKLSARIVKFRDRLGGFLVNEQLYDVYGLEPEVADRALKHFQVLRPPEVKKININTANVDELASLVYLRYHVAQNIVTYREENGAYASLKDLFNVSEFPINKIDRIGLYLSY